MKAIQCEMCGSNDVVKQGDYFVCQNCGTKYEPEAARKLMVEVDNSKALENLYSLARRARQNDSAEDAEKYYSKILESNPNDWEAYFFGAYFKALQSKQAYIASAAREMDKAVAQTVSLLLDSNADEKVATEAAAAMHARIPALAATFASNAISIQQQYLAIGDSAGKQHELEYKNMMQQSCNLAFNFGAHIDRLAKRYPGNAQLEKIVVDSSKDVLQADALEDFLPFSSRTALLDRVHQYEPSYKASSQYSYPSAGKQSGCGTGIIVFIIVCLFIGIVVFVHSVLN